MFQINETHTFMSGGRNRNLLTEDVAYVYDWNGTALLKWTELPPMSRERYGHGCAVVEDGQGSRRVLVAGE